MYFIFWYYSLKSIQSQYLLQVLILLILMNKFSVPPTKKFPFLYFIRSILFETFTFKSIYLSALVEICNVRTFFEKVLRSMFQMKFV